VAVSETRIYSQGLREEDTQTRRDANHDWQRVVFHRLRLEYDKLGRGENTKASEDGLGMDPSAYWYVARLEPDFAWVATLSTDALRQGGPGMACAFDTGGLWHDWITLVVPLTTPAQKRDFLRRNRYSLDGYHPTMRSWLDSAYEPQPVVHYSRGVQPKVHTIPEVSIADDTRSWTWEVSVSVNCPAASFPPATSLHMTEQRYDQYESWVLRLRELSSFEVYDHLDFVERIISTSGNPYEDAIQLLIGSAT
jgi:hypothetical protein